MTIANSNRSASMITLWIHPEPKQENYGMPSTPWSEATASATA
jgi:hypothetical protein